MFKLLYELYSTESLEEQDEYGREQNTSWAGFNNDNNEENDKRSQEGVY